MTRVDLVLSGTGANSKVVIDGVDVSSKVHGLTLEAEVGAITMLTVEYPCTEVTSVTGDIEVVHFCPYPNVDEFWEDDG